MAMNLNFHSILRSKLVKHEHGTSVWYQIYLEMDNYAGGFTSESFCLFLGCGVKSISPFEEMWQAQEAARLAQEKWANGEKVESMLTDDDGPRDPLPSSDFSTDPDLAADLEEGTSSPVAQETLNARA